MDQLQVMPHIYIKALNRSCGDLALQRERHRLGFIVSHSHLWPLANGAHAYDSPILVSGGIAGEPQSSGKQLPSPVLRISSLAHIGQ